MLTNARGLQRSANVLVENRYCHNLTMTDRRDNYVDEDAYDASTARAKSGCTRDSVTQRCEASSLTPMRV